MNISFNLNIPIWALVGPGEAVASPPVVVRVVAQGMAVEILIAFMRLTIISRATKAKVLKRLTVLEFTMNSHKSIHPIVVA